MRTGFPCGIVEGFYGPPWSHLDRLYMIRFLSENGFNVYMYAPKDDPYHRAKWRERYPDPLKENLGELIEASNLHSVSFVFTVSPGLNIMYSNPKELESLLEKLNFAIDLGSRWVGIMLDDIDTNLGFQEDKNKFSKLATAHACLLNTVSERIRGERKNIRISFCPTYYANDYLGKKVGKNEYLSEIGAQMDPSIDILWTGKYVVSPQITERDAIEFEKVVRRKPLLWDNYPVNDYFRAEVNSTLGLRLNLGAFAGRSPEALEHLAGYLSNPMNECEASKISLLTLKDMIHEPDAYSPARALDNALRILFSGDEINAARSLIEVSKASALDPQEAESLRKLVSELIASETSGGKWQEIASELRRLLTEYANLRERFQTGLRNRKVLLEIEPILLKLKSLASFGLDCLDYVEKVKNSEKEHDDASSKLESKKKLEREMLELGKDKTQVLGQIYFGVKIQSDEGIEENANESSYTDLGLPYLKMESPVIDLYEWARI
jgi:hyaluronoglucosaminidase